MRVNRLKREGHKANIRGLDSPDLFLMITCQAI